MTAGRFAPSPSGDLHIGNLRTAVLAWLFARSTGRKFFLRMEDLDRVRSGAEESQIADLASVGVDFDPPMVRQSEHLDRYEAAIDRLTDAGLTYECYCTRREILQAPTAPHQPPGAYPGTCRDLSDAERSVHRRERPPAIRLRTDTSEWTVTDLLRGEVSGAIDDVVLRRGDGVPAYNLAVVVDDAAMGVDQVVRGDDLLSSAPRQAYLARQLGLEVPRYAHVPLVLNTSGRRLAKRDGPVGFRELTERGANVLALISTSLGLTGSTLPELLTKFDRATIPLEPWVFDPSAMV